MNLAKLWTTLAAFLTSALVLGAVYFFIFPLGAVTHAQELDFGDSAGTKGGSGGFTKFVPQGGRALIGTIPKGIKDLEINLTAEADLDIELWDGKTFVVGWESDGTKANISSGSKISGKYNDVGITWSGWNGVDNALGNEYIRLTGITNNAFVMKVFGYRAGDVKVVYNWKSSSTGPAATGSGSFAKLVPLKDRATIGTIPAGIEDLSIVLAAEKDLDVELWDGSTFVVGWQSNGINALIYSSTEISGTYNGVDITWSGWNGLDGQLGNEFIRINGVTQNSFVMKVFGYQAGSVQVDYEWGPESETESVTPWARAYGQANDEEAHSIVATTDGGYVVVGHQLYGGGARVLKLDGNGTVVWQKRIGTGGRNKAYTVESIADGGFVVAGSSPGLADSSKTQPSLFKLDANGSEIWQMEYELPLGGTLRNIRQTADGGFIAAGTAGSGDALVLKLNGEGTIEWQKTYGGSETDSFKEVYPTTDGGYIAVGQTWSFGAGIHDIWAVKMTASGNVTWQRRYGGSAADEAVGIRQMSGGGYIVAATSVSFGSAGSALVMELSPEGTVLETKVYDRPSGYVGRIWLTTLEESHDGGYVIAGSASFGTWANKRTWIAKLDGSAEMLWARQYNGFDNSAIDILSTGDGYTVAGNTDAYGGGGADMLVMHIGSTGALAPLDSPGDDRVTEITLEAFDTDSESIDALAVSIPSAQFVTDWDAVGVAPE